MFRKTGLAVAMTLAAVSANAEQAPSMEEMWKIIQQQQAEIKALKGQLDNTDSKLEMTEKKVEATADAVEAAPTGKLAKAADFLNRTTIGGYGEHHFNRFKDKDDMVDAHRYVLFVGHEFRDDLRFFSELEVEHGLVFDSNDGSGDESPGEVELEQAYIEWDYAENQSAKFGQFLIPVGIMNETHEPDTFYGTERNVVEKNIIPATWWETGVMLSGEIAPGISYDAGVHSGLEMADGDKIRSGRQKSAKANAEDLAYTGRIKYTGIAGLEVAATVQYQEDVTQGGVSAGSSDAVLWETHIAYENGPFGLRALYADWDIDAPDGGVFDSSGRDSQKGYYIEPSYKITPKLGVFVRYSEYDNNAGSSTSTADILQWDAGVNYWLHPNVVLKADYTDERKDCSGSSCTDNDSVNLGLGWSF